MLLTNTGDMKAAITPLRKATQLESKDAQAWFLLGRALLATTETKQGGSDIRSVFLPGTAEAFQKCLDADPNGPYASHAREALDGLASLRAGEKPMALDKKKR